MELADLEQEMLENQPIEESKQDQNENQKSNQEEEVEQREDNSGEGEEEEEENELSPEEQQLKDLRFLQGYWKLPAIAQFIKIFFPILGINQMSPQELEQCILRPEIDGTLGTLIQKLLQKPNAFDNDKACVSNNSRTNSHHIPILNDMKEYKNWNEKLARKMSFMHKLYKRFIVKYDLKCGKLQDENSKDTGYSSEILKHLINYDETDCSMRFLHEDMKIFDSETLAIVKLFEEMDGRNPFTSKSTIEVLPLDNPENCDNSNHEGDIIEKNYEEEPCDDEEFILCMHEIPIKFRADVILFLCSLKADTEEFSKHIKKIEEDEAKQRVTTRSKSLKDNKKAANDNVSEDISNNSKK